MSKANQSALSQKQAAAGGSNRLALSRQLQIGQPECTSNF